MCIQRSPEIINIVLFFRNNFLFGNSIVCGKDRKWAISVVFYYMNAKSRKWGLYFSQDWNYVFLYRCTRNIYNLLSCFYCLLNRIYWHYDNNLLFLWFSVSRSTNCFIEQYENSSPITCQIYLGYRHMSQLSQLLLLYIIR